MNEGSQRNHMYTLYDIRVPFFNSKKIFTYKKSLSIDRLDEEGARYRIIGSAAKHLIELSEEERKRDGGSSKEWVLFQGGVEIYHDVKLISRGSVWRIAPLRNNLLMPSGFRDLLFWDAHNGEEMDAKIKAILNGYEFMTQRQIDRIYHENVPHLEDVLREQCPGKIVEIE